MPLPTLMAAVQLIGHGDYDMLHYSETLSVPLPGTGEVLIRVKAAGINNTDVNTRIGWYAATVRQGTAEASEGHSPIVTGDWSGRGLTFPRIQGADVCGEIVSVGEGVAEDRIGERVIVQSCLLSRHQGRFTPWLGSEFDGGFAQFVRAPAADTYQVCCTLSDAQLAAVPCAYGTAENMLHRTGLAEGETVLVTGASGNVGLAAVQLARLRGAHVIAIVATEKSAAVEAAGAERCIARGAPLIPSLQADSIDCVIDLVGGPQWPQLLDVLHPQGRLAVSGAIAGPIVEMDLRTVYVKDLSLFGCTSQHPDVFGQLICYLEKGQLRPVVAKQYPLKEIADAQRDFLSKKRVGKIVLIPHASNS
jgi:NADPH:quinone reductase-like Zn-dependent oxidoreductase